MCRNEITISPAPRKCGTLYLLLLARVYGLYGVLGDELVSSGKAEEEGGVGRG